MQEQTSFLRILSCHINLMEVIISVVQKIQMAFCSFSFEWVSAVNRGIVMRSRRWFHFKSYWLCFSCFVSGGSSMLWSMNYRPVAEISQPETCISCHLVKLNSFCWIFSSLNRMEGNEGPLLPIEHSGLTVSSYFDMYMKLIR